MLRNNAGPRKMKIYSLRVFININLIIKIPLKSPYPHKTLIISLIVYLIVVYLNIK